eukprot:TRINITY_DN3433_c0_g1_i1.p1 TRINITY_DN3433_c0_g1~~TRINITY_DN3433_c0_g1_i1.p1  ORF type:complete len:262 (+),score=20.80 TRINITY_DN3433_c0_g1_i1:56-841(+)
MPGGHQSIWRSQKRLHRKMGTGSRYCRLCGNHHALIRKYGLFVCRQCFRENADQIGFEKARNVINASFVSVCCRVCWMRAERSLCWSCHLRKRRHCHAVMAECGCEDGCMLQGAFLGCSPAWKAHRVEPPPTFRCAAVLSGAHLERGGGGIVMPPLPILADGQHTGADTEMEETDMLGFKDVDVLLPRAPRSGGSRRGGRVGTCGAAHARWTEVLCTAHVACASDVTSPCHELRGGPVVSCPQRDQRIFCVCVLSCLLDAC